MNTLVIKIGAIGDLLMAGPAIRAIRKSSPNEKVSVLIGRSCESVLRSNPWVDELLPIDDHKLYKGSPAARLGQVLKIVLLTRRNRFDRVFVFHRDWRFNLVAALSGARERFGFDRNGEGRFLTQRYRPVDGVHHIDQYLAVAALADVAPQGREMEFSVSDSARRSALRKLSEAGGSLGSSLVGICPGGARNVREQMDSRRWPVENFDRLLDALLANTDLHALILGGPSDLEIIERLNTRRPRVHVLAGQTSLEESAALMARCRVVVANDSGPMHLAAAMGVPVVSLFGPTDPREKWPLSPGSVHLWRPDDLPCCPCYRDGKFPVCPIDLKCLRRIEPDEVLLALMEIVRRDIAPRPGVG